MRGILKCKVSRNELMQAHKDGRAPESEYSFEERNDIEIDYDGLAKVFAEVIIEKQREGVKA